MNVYRVTNGLDGRMWQVQASSARVAINRALEGGDKLTVEGQSFSVSVELVAKGKTLKQFKAERGEA